MPKKLLALLLSIIALSALIDLGRSAKMQLADAFASRPIVTTANATQPGRTAPHKAKAAGPSKIGIAPSAIMPAVVPARWEGPDPH